MGRIVRLVLGIACFYALYELITYRAGIISTPVSVLPNIALLVLAALLIINYVVNIGFGRSWRRWPSYVSVATMLVLAAVSWLAFGTPDHVLLGLGIMGLANLLFHPLGLVIRYFGNHRYPGLRDAIDPRAVRAHDRPTNPGASLPRFINFQNRRLGAGREAWRHLDAPTQRYPGEFGVLRIGASAIRADIRTIP